MAKKWPKKVVQRSFIKGHSFPIGLYVQKWHFLKMTSPDVDEQYALLNSVIQK